jgi:hypothetical protein
MTTTTHTPGPWAYTLCEDAPYTYTPRARFASVRPGVHVTVNWSHGYHTPEQDAQYRADALAVSDLIAEAPAMLATLRECLTTLDNTLAARGYRDGESTDAWAPEVRAEVAQRAKLRAILTRIDGEA